MRSACEASLLRLGVPVVTLYQFHVPDPEVPYEESFGEIVRLQEEGNVEYVLQNDVGVLARDPIELIDAIRRLVKPGSARMHQQVANARRLSRPGASFDIVHCILSYLPAVSKSIAWQTVQSRRRHRIVLRSPEVRLRALRRRLPRMTQITFLKSPVMRRLSHLRTHSFSYRFSQLEDRSQQPKL